MPSCSLTLLTQSRRREGLTSFPWQPLSRSACRASAPRPPCEAECSPARAPSSRFTWSPFRPHTQTASGNRSSPSHPTRGQRRPRLSLRQQHISLAQLCDNLFSRMPLPRHRVPPSDRQSQVYPWLRLKGAGHSLPMQNRLSVLPFLI